MPPAPVRLEFADDLFARRHRGLGSPVVNQWVWRLEKPYDAARVKAVAEGLARGGLSRRLHRAVVPGARDIWTNAGEPPVADLGCDPIPAGELSAWLKARHLEHLDPEEGLTWRLAATDLDDGTGVVSLILAHAVGDGGSVLDSVMRAATGADPLELPPLPSTLPGRLVEDAKDAAGQFAAIGRWVGARIRAQRAGAAAPGARKRGPAPTAEAPATTDSSWEAARLTVELETGAIADVAARHGGSSNSWFVAVMARLLVTIGHVPEDGGPVPVSLPMSEFRPGDTRSNSTRVTRVEVPREALADRDLAVVKALCKEAYTRLATAGTGFVPVPLALIQMLPDAVVKQLPTPPSASCMASNLGNLPDDYVHAFGPDVRSITGMASYQQASAAEVRAMGGGLIAWLVNSGRRTTFTIIGAEPDRIADTAALTALVTDELGSCGLDAEPW
ncbi:hypothetical protein [Nocardioides sp. KR10-350]|uniref:hypothetical protein n=1 Tax=Nocardioides cheoyonin TaxID=3156615 RepID=UPI0032B4E09C